MPFEKFSRAYGYRPRHGTYVSITKQGTFLFPLDFYTKHLKDHKGIELYYEKIRNVIGFKPVKELNEDAYPLKAQGTIARGRKQPINVVYGISFMKYFEIEHSGLKRYVPVWNEQEGVFEIDLNNPIEAIAQRKKN
jgi:hypothetical protein